jgi:F-type H+-transporting ATPase subunit delta
MTESVTIARPYAQAVFQLAKESRSLAEWSERLDRLAAIAKAPEMGAVIGNPKFSARQLVDLIMSLSGEPGNQALMSFVSLLAENGRFDAMADIATLFESLKREDEGVKEALIASAFPLDGPTLAELQKTLEAHFDSRLQARVEVDPSLIGGVRVKVGDRVFDASVRGKLDAMAAALKN